MPKKLRDMKYEHVGLHSNSNKNVYTSLKIVNCKYRKSQSFVSIFLKMVSKLSDYTIIMYFCFQIFLVEHSCTAVHYQHKINKPH